MSGQTGRYLSSPVRMARAEWLDALADAETWWSVLTMLVLVLVLPP